MICTHTVASVLQWWTKMQINSRVFFPGLSRDILTTCIAHIFFTWVLPWLQYWSSLFTLRLQSINSVITRLLIQKAFYFSLDIKAKQHRARLTWVGWEVNLGQEKMCSTGCSGKGLIIIWFLPLHSPTKFSFSPQNRSVSVDTLNSLHLAHAHAVLMQGHGFTEPGLVTRVQMHPEHRGLTSTGQITGTHFWARSPRQCLGSNTYGWTLFETVTNCQETCNKNIFRATEWLRVPKLSKREESIQNKETVSFFISTLPSRLKYEPGNARMRESTCNAWYYRFNFFHHLYILLSHVHWIMIRYSSPEIELENHFWQNSSLDALQSIWRVVNQHAT